MSRVEVPARPVRSDSVTTARRRSSATKPARTGAAVTRTTPGLRLGRPPPRPGAPGRRRRSAARPSARPDRGPRSPAPGASRRAAARAGRPPPGRRLRGTRGRRARRPRASRPASRVARPRTRRPTAHRRPAHRRRSAMNALSVHQPSRRDSASSRVSAKLANDAARRSIGVLAPAAAAVHAASRNSWVVAIRSCARRRTRSGSTTTTSASSPTMSSTGTISSTSTGASDSIPSTAIPSASFASMSAAPGSSVGQRSRLGPDRVGEQDLAARRRPQARPSATSRLRWSATANQRISSTRSPQNSTRTGWSSIGGKTSRIPPRTANSPRRSTMSTRV